MGMNRPVTVRIRRLVVEAATRADGEATVAAFRSELARLVADGRLPSAAGGTLTAVTPAGRGRQASAMLAPRGRIR